MGLMLFPTHTKPANIAGLENTVFQACDVLNFFQQSLEHNGSFDEKNFLPFLFQDWF